MNKRMILWIWSAFFVTLVVIFLLAIPLSIHNGDKQDRDHNALNNNAASDTLPKAQPINTRQNSSDIVNDENRVEIPAGVKLPEIDFFGKVIDQEGRPVVEAYIDVRISKGKRFCLITNSQGVFGLKDLRSWRLEIEKIEKPGYLEPPKPDIEHRGFILKEVLQEGKRSIGTLENPIIYHLIKKSTIEPLLETSVPVTIRDDFTKSRFVNLITRKYSSDHIEPADLKISFHRDPLHPKNNKYDWSCTIEAINGGFISDDLSLYTAPQDGYETKLHWKHITTDPSWKNGEKKRVFLRTRNEQVYGRLEIVVFPKYGNDLAVIRFRGILNPNNSRNLETSVANDNIFSSFEELNKYKSRVGIKKGTTPSPHTDAKPPGVYIIQEKEQVKLEPKVTKTFDFFGIVVDQNGDPVKDVKIVISAGRALYGRLPPVIYRATTDGNGFFHLEHVRPCNLGVSITKDNYTLDPNTPKRIPFSAKHLKGRGMSLDNPWTWKMRKSQGSAGPLIQGQKESQVPANGEPCVINIIAPAEGGDFPEGVAFKISMNRLPMSKFKKSTKWDFSVEAISGGLVETSDPFMYLAPEGGYEKTLNWTINRNAQRKGISGGPALPSELNIYRLNAGRF